MLEDPGVLESSDPAGDAPWTTRDVAAARQVVADLFGPPEGRNFDVRYGADATDVGSDAAFTLVLRRPGSLRRMLLPPSELSIVEAYLFGDVDVDGDLEAAADLGDAAAKRLRSLGDAARLWRELRTLPAHDDDASRGEGAHEARRLFRFGRIHTRQRDAQVVRFHYDVGNDFFQLWLDPRMVYSCAYFEHADASLEEAQVAKLDLVCRKLRLREGERLLDIGCGWGALVIHAAQQYGVHATGINLSEQQAELARARVQREGLSEHVSIVIRDYRDLGTRDDDRFDKISSVGMVEHVGESRLGDYFAAAYRVLEPGGLFLNHGIVNVSEARPRSLLDPLWRRLWKRDQFIRRYVFPDGDLVTAAIVISAAERAGFELRDVESLREHYMRTLRHWVRRLEANQSAAREIVGDVTYRVWRLYMAAAAYGFRTGRLAVIQSLLAKVDEAGKVNVPLTREDLYS